MSQAWSASPQSLQSRGKGKEGPRDPCCLGIPRSHSWAVVRVCGFPGRGPSVSQPHHRSPNLAPCGAGGPWAIKEDREGSRAQREKSRGVGSVEGTEKENSCKGMLPLREEIHDGGGTRVPVPLQTLVGTTQRFPSVQRLMGGNRPHRAAHGHARQTPRSAGPVCAVEEWVVLGAGHYSKDSRSG